MTTLTKLKDEICHEILNDLGYRTNTELEAALRKCFDACQNALSQMGGEFKKGDAFIEAKDQGLFQGSFVAGAKWQFEQMSSQLGAAKAENERLGNENDSAKAAVENYSFHYKNLFEAHDKLKAELQAKDATIVALAHEISELKERLEDAKYESMGEDL